MRLFPEGDNERAGWTAGMSRSDTLREINKRSVTLLATMAYHII